MSHNKKRGLQHKLSDILKPVISLEEKTKYTSQLLSRIAPKENFSNTSDQQSPVDQQSPLDQQSLVPNSHQYYINLPSENLLMMDSLPKSNPKSGNNDTESFIDETLQENPKRIDQQQRLVTNSHQYTDSEIYTENFSTNSTSLTDKIEEADITSTHTNISLTTEFLQKEHKNTNDQQSPVSESPVDQQRLVTNSHQYTDPEIYTENFSTNSTSLTDKTEEADITSTHTNISLTTEFLQKEHKNTNDQQSPVSESPVDQQTPVTNSHQYTDPERNFVKVPNIVFDKFMSVLDPYEFKVYLRLFRLSHGFHKTQCIVGYTSLAQACDLSIRHVKRVIPELEIKGFIKNITTYNSANIKGTLYEIFTSDQQALVTEGHQRPTVSSVLQSPNKVDDDHDDLKKTDHHQSEHEKAVMMIYQKITGNYWSKADIASYDKIKNIPLESIETAIKLATQRAANRPNSLAYFVKEIINTANPPKQNRSQRKKAMEKIVDRVRNSFVGSSYTMFDFTHKVKDLCFKEDIGFDNDIFNEILDKKK